MTAKMLCYHMPCREQLALRRKQASTGYDSTGVAAGAHMVSDFMRSVVLPVSM